jgi:putative transposase
MKYKLGRSAHSVYSLHYHLEILAQEPAEDHLHILFTTTPTTNLSNVVNVIKGVTARRLRQEFPQTKEFLWGDSFWSDSYFIASTGQVSLDVLMQYVESQMEKV